MTRRHDRFYFSDGTVVFEVSLTELFSEFYSYVLQTQDHILFRLFKSVLIERSSVLAGMFSLPQGTDDAQLANTKVFPFSKQIIENIFSNKFFLYLFLKKKNCFLKTESNGLLISSY